MSLPCIVYLACCCLLWSASDIRTQTIPHRYVALGLLGWLVFPTHLLHGLIVFVLVAFLLDLPGGDLKVLTALALYVPSPWDAAAIVLGASVVGILVLWLTGARRCWFVTPFFPFLAVGVGAMLALRSIYFP